MQTVETLNCTIERTETPPYFRLTSLRKASSNSESNMLLTSSRQDLNALGNDGAMKGTIHTKRHSQQDASDHQRDRSAILHLSAVPTRSRIRSFHLIMYLQMGWVDYDLDVPHLAQQLVVYSHHSKQNLPYNMTWVGRPKF